MVRAWTLLATSLYDRMPQIDAWAVGAFRRVAGIQNDENSFARWLLYLSPYVRIGEFVLGVIAAQLYVALRSRNVTRRENAIGGAVFWAAALSVLLVTYLAYSPDVPLTIFRKMSWNFALAPSVALLVFCAARYQSAASRLLTSRPAHCARRGELLDIPGAFDRADQRRQADRKRRRTAPPTMSSSSLC